MLKLEVKNQLGEKVEEIKLSDKVFKVEPNMQVIYDVVNSQRAGKRQGTHDTKVSSEVRGGGRKPYRQKGTGRARQGTIRAPQYRGGGTVFGPTPHKYVLKVNKKVVKLATKILLSDKARAKAITVVDKFELAEPKTKGILQILDNLSVDKSKKILVITEDLNWNLNLAGRNIPNVYVQTKSHLSVYDLVNSDYFVMTKKAVLKYEEELK